jgi:hypothetical protein
MLAIVSKHMSDNYAIVRFLGIINLTDAAAQPTVDHINQLILAKNLNDRNLYHLGSDGASTMLGKFL